MLFLNDGRDNLQFAIPRQMLNLCYIQLIVGNTTPYFDEQSLSILLLHLLAEDLEPRQRSVVGTAALLLAVRSASFLLDPSLTSLFYP
jgi:hypothetical protein